jgi:hypothetical protein
MKLTKIWIVRNPNHLSLKEDMCWESTIDKFASYCCGAGVQQFVSEQHFLYTSKEEADVDADMRLRVRDSLIEILELPNPVNP